MVSSYQQPAGTLRAMLELLLWLLAVGFVVAGLVSLVRRQFAWGAVLVLLGLIIGPGGQNLLSF